MPAPQASSFIQLTRLSFNASNNRPITPMSGQRPIMKFGGNSAPMDYQDFLDKISGAICGAWSVWCAGATLTGVMVNGVTASGGTVVGPPWGPLIMAQMQTTTPEAKLLTQNIASVIGDAWAQFTSSISVPGMPWYPAFAALPSPVAPPMPNIPCPLAAIAPNRISVSKSVVKAMMVSKEPGASSDHQKVYDAVADAFEKTVNLFIVSTMVTNVLGTGPVPAFAPPYVPVGPVVGGVANMLPGGFV